jgi:RHS repeat-associated protein
MKIVITKPNDVANSGSIEFTYDATGAKLKKIIKDNAGVVKETWDYVNGVAYKNRILQRVPHSEGAVVQNEFGAYEHQYTLRDHLGNTRVTFRDGVNKGEAYVDWNLWAWVDPNAGNTTYNGMVGDSDIVQINHYYPFGLNLEGNWNGAQGKNKYQYNGKEWNDDFGLGWNHHDWRFLDVAINRFVTVDPECETGDQKSWNPYHFGFDDPIRHSDPDGRFPIETFWDIANVVYDVGKLAYHGATGNTAAVAIDLKDLGADAVATLVPYVPAGATKIARALNNTVKVVNAAGAAKQIIIRSDDEKNNEKKSGKNEKHGDSGRAKTKAEKQVEGLKEQLKDATGSEKQKLKQKIQNIEQDAAKKAKGEEHSRTKKG